MSCFIICYDKDSGEKNAPLIDAIQTYGNYWDCLNATWIVVSDLSSDQILDHLERYLGDTDKLFVGELSGESGAIGFDDECSDWLEANMGL